jgi:hypothetical protein
MRVAAVVTVPLGEDTDPTDVDGVNVGRPAGDAATAAAVVFPLAPTVVHAPPTGGTDEVTLLVVSAYARRDALAAMGSLKAAFFRFSSSSNMSLIDFLVAGF